MKEFILRYLKSKFPVVSVFVICFLIFFILMKLYRIETDAVLYAFILCVLILIPFSAYKCATAYKKYKKLERILESKEIILQNDTLPEQNNIIELEYQKLLWQSQKEKQALASDFELKRTDNEDYYTLWAHQIKTPISAMRLLLQTNDGELSRECSLELIKIEQYVEMVLGYLRLESDSSDFVIKSYNVDSIIKTAVKKFSRQFILNKISLDYSETGLNAITDEKWLGFVIEQIISNALKYTKQGTVSIYAVEEKLCIKDTGIGIAPEDLPRVFEKGYTGYNGRTDRKSTGLGLYLCKRITSKLGHELTIESQVSVGTTVIINLKKNELNIE